jgi:hypothetical protein
MPKPYRVIIREDDCDMCDDEWMMKLQDRIKYKVYWIEKDTAKRVHLFVWTIKF